MKLREFKQLHRDIFNKSSEEGGLGRFLPVLIHHNEKLYIEVKFKSQDRAESTEEINLTYIDKIKKRIFYIGLDEDLWYGFFGRKKPLGYKMKNIVEWASKSTKYDDYDVYFALKYDKNDLDEYIIMPLGPSIEFDPTNTNPNAIVYKTEGQLRSGLKSLNECKFETIRINFEPLRNRSRAV